MKFFTLFLFIICSLSIYAQDDLSKAKNAFAQKDYNTAISLLKQFLNSNSRNVEANYLLGEAYRLTGDLPKAQMQLERALDFDDEYEPALASVIRVYGSLKLWEKAQKFYNYAAKYHKNGVLAPLAYAQTYLEADSLDKAAIYFSKVKENDPNNADAYVGLSEVYARQNVIVLAVDNLRTATQFRPEDPALWYKLATTILKNRVLNADQIREVIAALQKSIDIDPNNSQAILDAANIFYRIKYWREAAEFYKKYHDKEKGNADSWEKYGTSAYNAKAYPDAIAPLEQAVKFNSKNLELKSMLAHCFYTIKEYRKAMDVYKNIPPDSLGKDDVYRMGFSSFQLSDTVNAVKYLEKTIAMDPDYTDAVGTLAAIYLTQKKYDKAVVQYDRLLAKDPNNLTALFYAGYSYFVLGKNDTAKGYYKQLIALRPNNIQVHQSLLQIYGLQDSLDMGRYHANMMIELADSAMKADPKKADQQALLAIAAYRMLGLFDYKEKKIKEAIDKLEKAVTYEKGKPDENLHLFLAQMYAVRSGDKELLADEARAIREKACKEYAVVLKINPRNAAAKKESAQMNCGK
jgi:tetratricopeptide (TPR) repeat protein